MTSTMQLERETEQTRSQLADSLDELRACMTPGQIFDQMADYARDGAAGAFARNLRQQAVNNPLPLVMMGASLAWLMMGGRGPDFQRASRGVADRAQAASAKASETAGDAVASGVAAAKAGSETLSERIAETREDAASKARSAKDRMGNAMADAQDRTSETLSSATGSIRSAASDAYDAVTEGVREKSTSMSESVKAAGQRTLATGNSFVRFCQEQPVLVAGIGVVVGAALGTLLPRSEAEDRVMGEASDTLKERATDASLQQASKVTKVADRAMSAAQQEAERQGLAVQEPDRVGEEADAASLVPADQGDGMSGAEAQSDRR